MIYSTDWAYDTSEDSSYSLFLVSGGYGTLYLTNTTNGDKMSVPYRYVGVGQSKGEDIGHAASTTDMESSGVGNVMGFGSAIFDEQTFPCSGMILNAGAATSASDNGPADGGAYTIYFFGVPPTAAVKCTGKYLASSSGFGVAACLASFSAATLTEGAGATTASDDGSSPSPDPGGGSSDAGQPSGDPSAAG